jgi:hypothetical protein
VRLPLPPDAVRARFAPHDAQPAGGFDVVVVWAAVEEAEAGRRRRRDGIVVAGWEFAIRSRPLTCAGARNHGEDDRGADGNVESYAYFNLIRWMLIALRFIVLNGYEKYSVKIG